MENKIIARRRALEAALATVRYQIANLKKHYSPEQVRCWYKHRDSLIKALEALPAIEQVRADAKRNTALRKSINSEIQKRLTKRL